MKYIIQNASVSHTLEFLHDSHDMIKLIDQNRIHISIVILKDSSFFCFF